MELLGLRHPVALLPVLLLESGWKVLWLAVVVLPRALHGGLGAATTEIVASCSLVVGVIAVTPWRFVRRHPVGGPGDSWH